MTTTTLFSTELAALATAWQYLTDDETIVAPTTTVDHMNVLPSTVVAVDANQSIRILRPVLISQRVLQFAQEHANRS